MSDENSAHSQHKNKSKKSTTLSKQELADIYDQYYLSIYRFIFRQVGDVEVSRELSSEVFHRMVKYNRNDIGQMKYLARWLYCVARNIVVDHYRRQQHRNHLSLNDEMIDSLYDTVETAEIHISTEKMRDALKKLTPEQRQVIVLKFMEGRSNQEIAEILSKPVGAVKSLQHRALTALRHILDPNEERVIV